ncbi:MAG: hypothetical protein ACRBEE_15600 [Arenicella sp.]
MLKRLFIVLFSLLSILITVLSWLFPDPLSTGFFSLSYHKILITALGLGATLIASLLWFALINGGASFFSRVFSVFLFGLAIIVSTIVGYQLGAPSYSVSGASFVEPKTKVSYGSVVEEAGILFKMGECIGSGTLVRCELEIKSLGQDRKVNFNSGTSLIDENGNKSPFHKLYIGDKPAQRYRDVTFVANLETKVAIEFSGFSRDSKYASLITIKANYSNLRNNILMRRIEVKRHSNGEK